MAKGCRANSTAQAFHNTVFKLYVYDGVDRAITIAFNPQGADTLKSSRITFKKPR